MKTQEALKLLKHHQEWRMGAEIEMLSPRTISMSINKAIKVLESVNPKNPKPFICECGNGLSKKEVFYQKCLKCHKDLGDELSE